jgi:protein phosphatase PTC1
MFRGCFCLLGCLTAHTAQVGCISTPEIMRKVIDANVKFIVLATDGVWDVLDNQFVVDMVNSIPDPAEACNAVIQAAMLRWEDKYSADNITVVVVRFHADSSRPP